MASEYEPEITPEMRARYISRRRDDLAKLEEGSLINDFATIAAIAHQIKGNAATFSFEDLESYAVTLEEAALASSPDASRRAIESIRAWLDRQG